MSKGKHGGPRPNSGRRKGAMIRRTQEVMAGAAAAGLLPLEFMLQVLRDETQPFEARFDAAKNAAPYIHPRLAAVEHKTDGKQTMVMAILTGVPRPEPKALEADTGANDDSISATAH